MNIIIKRFLALFLSFTIVFSSVTSANASVSSIGGWTALDTITAGATNTINAVKGAGATGMRSAVAVAPSVVKVGKHLIKGGGAAALAFAVVELADGAVDWLLDPANNRVKYKNPAEPGNGLLYQMIAVPSNWYGTKEGACRGGLGAFNASVNGGLYNYRFIETYGSNGMTCLFYSDITGNNYQYLTSKEGGQIEDEWKYIPIETVAAKVIANAEAGHLESKEAVKAVALEGFAAGEYDDALDAAAVPDSTVGTENPPVDTPTDPVKPFDPSSIISAIASLKALLSGILSSIMGLSDFFQSPPPPDPKPEDTQLDIPDSSILPADTDINFGGSCPSNFEVNSSIFGNPVHIVLLDTSKFCGFLSTFVKFPVYAVSSLYALYILGGRKDV